MADGEAQATVVTETIDSGSDQSSSGFGASSRRGRPKGSRNKGTPLDTGHVEESRAKSSPSPDALESAKFIGVGFVSLVELVESFVHSNCANRIEKKMPQKLGEFKQMAQQMGLQEKDKELMSSCAEKIAGKYEVMTKFAPEVVLCVAMAQYSLRQVLLMKFVDNVTKEKKADPTVKPAETAPSESNQV